MAKQGKDWKSYDGREVEEGQVLVPQRVEPEFARDSGAVMDNLRTWTTAGVRYTVMFIPVSMDNAIAYWKLFWSDINVFLDERLGPGRRGRKVVSLDAMLEDGYLPVETESSTESVAMEGILLEELLAAVGKLNPLYGDVIRLGYQGMDRKGIVNALPVKKSQAYDVIRKCQEEAERWVK